MSETTAGAHNPEQAYTIPQLAYAMAYRTVHDLAGDLPAAWQIYGFEAEAFPPELLTALIGNSAKMYEGILGEQDDPYKPEPSMIEALLTAEGRPVTDEAVDGVGNFLSDPEVNPISRSATRKNMQAVLQREIQAAEEVAREHGTTVTEVFLRDDLFGDLVRRSISLPQYVQTRLRVLDGFTLEDVKGVCSSYLLTRAQCNTSFDRPESAAQFDTDIALLPAIEKLYTDPQYLIRLKQVLAEAKAVASIVLRIRIARLWGEGARQSLSADLQQALVAPEQIPDEKLEELKDQRYTIQIGDLNGEIILDADLMQSVLDIAQTSLLSRMITS